MRDTQISRVNRPMGDCIIENRSPLSAESFFFLSIFNPGPFRSKEIRHVYWRVSVIDYRVQSAARGRFERAVRLAYNILVRECRLRSFSSNESSRVRNNESAAVA